MRDAVRCLVVGADAAVVAAVVAGMDAPGLRCSGTLDPAGFPYAVEINKEVRGTLRTRDDALEVKGVAADAQISFRSRYADQQGDPAKQLEPGESVELNSCVTWSPTFSYCCLQQQTCVNPLPGFGQPYCYNQCVWTCWNYICTS